MNQEKVKGYIDYDTGIPPKKTFESILMMFIILGIPTSLFGSYSNVTRITLIPLIIIFSVWTIYLLIIEKYSKGQLTIYLGGCSLFISLLFMLAAYKLALMAYSVSTLEILMIILLYVITNIINILNVIRLIKKGYYLKKGKNESPLTIYMSMSILGLSMGKILFINTSQETAITVVVSCLLFMSFVFSIGIHNFLRYYLIKNIKSL